MPNQASNTGFDPDEFIDSIIQEMGMGNEDPEKLEELKMHLETQMDFVIMNTASLYIEPDVIDGIMQRYPDINDTSFLFAEMVKASDKTQWAIITALDEFREETLNAYQKNQITCYIET